MTFAADHMKKKKKKKKNGSLQEHVDCAEETSLCQEDNKFSWTSPTGQKPARIMLMAIKST